MNVLLDDLFGALLAPIFEAIAALFGAIIGGLIELLIPLAGAVMAPFLILHELVAPIVFQILTAILIVLLGLALVETIFAPGWLPFLAQMPLYAIFGIGLVTVFLVIMPEAGAAALERRKGKLAVDRPGSNGWMKGMVGLTVVLTVILSLTSGLRSFLGEEEQAQARIEQDSEPAATVAATATPEECPTPDEDAGRVKRVWNWAKSKVTDC